MQAFSEEYKLIDQLRKSRFRATGQRLAVMQVLQETRNHPSAEDIYQKLKQSLPTLSLSTVYKTLQILAGMGKLLTIDTGMGSQRFDGHVHPHHHAVCTRCGKVFDVDFHKCPINTSLKDLLDGFNVQDIKVTFTGICHPCEKIKNAPAVVEASD